MPRNKDLKRVVRTRMQKTGESYTSARAHVLKKTARRASTKASANGRAATAAPDYAAIAGMSDKAVATKTGHHWEHWVRYLDRAGADTLSHKEIAKFLRDKTEVSGWWAQMITVAYERIKGLREKGQSCRGDYQMSKSKTLPVPVADLYRTFRMLRIRKQWYPDAPWTIRTATLNKSIRIGLDDGTRVQLYFWDKGPRKSQVSVHHEKLADKAHVERAKDFWAERLKEVQSFLKETAN
jgi:hypothetical protein